MSENRVFIVSENEDEVNFLALCSLDYYTRTPDEFKRMFTKDRVVRNKDFHDLGSLRLNKYICSRTIDYLFFQDPDPSICFIEIIE